MNKDKKVIHNVYSCKKSHFMLRFYKPPSWGHASSPLLPSPPFVLFVSRNDAVTRSGKASKALEKSRKQVEEGNKEAAQLKVLVFFFFIPSIFHLHHLHLHFRPLQTALVALKHIP